MRESSSSSSTISDGSPRRLFVGLPVAPTTSPRWTSTSPVRAAGQRSWMRPRAVDEVEEDELPHVSPRHHAPGEAARLRRLRPVLERVGLGANGRDLVAVRVALREGSVTAA